MRTGSRRILLLVTLLVCSAVAAAQGQGQGPAKEPFKGKLFAPDVILANRDELQLSDEQLAGIRSAVIDVQTNIAEHQWDLRDAYQLVLSDLDEAPVNEATVLEHVQAAMNAENEVKKLQVAMLIKLRNLLTEDQFAYLKSASER